MIGKCIVYEPTGGAAVPAAPAGAVAVFRPAPQWLDRVRAAERITATGTIREILELYHRRRGADLTDDEIMAYCLVRVLPNGRACQVVDEAELPERDEFRDAWRRRVDGDGLMRIAVDMPAARALHMGRIRQARDAELAKLDVKLMRAVEAGDALAVADIGKGKQRLRDLPATFDLSGAETTAELRRLWPASLPSETEPPG